MGAIASGGSVFLNRDVVDALQIDANQIELVAQHQALELARREQLYSNGRPTLDVRGRTVILVDDGLATGSTMRAAATALRQRQPGWIVVAVPVGASETCAAMHEVADDVVCVRTPEPLRAVGIWYEEFTQTTDEEVRNLLAEASWASQSAGAVGPGNTTPAG